MIKDIIENLKNQIDDFEYDVNRQALGIKSIIPDLEKSAIQEEALIKALVFELYNTCEIHCKKSDICINTCIHGQHRKLIESTTGKKWEEIKEVYR